MGPDSAVTGRSLQDIAFPKDAIVGTIIRGDQIIIPKGSDTLLAGDEVIVFALPGAISPLEKLFA